MDIFRDMQAGWVLMAGKMDQRTATDTALRLLTTIALAGLLFSAGLRLNWREIVGSLRRSRLSWILGVNFLLVPAMALGLVWAFQISQPVAVGMMLLAAAPFAPVVPTFARLARADQALAAALTGLFPFLSAFLTPLVCRLTLPPLLGQNSLTFNFWMLLVVLVLSITVPLAAGVSFHHYLPVLGPRLIKPTQVLSEAAGTVALAFVTIVEFHTIRSTGLKSLVAMGLLSELSFVFGYAIGGAEAASRLVVGLGTANRNIALAILVAVQSFPGTPIVAAVVGNGLLLILLGLAHVGAWRLRSWLKPGA